MKQNCLIGRAGIIVPTGIATDKSNSAYFEMLVTSRRLECLLDFENKNGMFPGVHKSYKFSVLSIGGSADIDAAFFLHKPSMMKDAERRLKLTEDSIRKFNPNTRTTAIFRSLFDVKLTEKAYGRAPILISRESANGEVTRNAWALSIRQGLFDMTKDSQRFRTSSELSSSEAVRTASEWVKPSGEAYMPLMEAKFVHIYDHRWRTYSEESKSIVPFSQRDKENQSAEVSTRYWVPKREVLLRISQAPKELKQALFAESIWECWLAMRIWIENEVEICNSDSVKIKLLAAMQNLRTTVYNELNHSISLDDSLAANSQSLMMPDASRCRLNLDEIEYLSQSNKKILEVAESLVRRKAPRWIMGWRNIARSTDRRTVIPFLAPTQGVGNSCSVLTTSYDARMTTLLFANLSSLVFDYIARQKVGGINLNLFYMEQLPVLTPGQYNAQEKAYVIKRVLELCYTSNAMRPWACEIGYHGKPFAFDAHHRALCRAELDAFFAIKYGMTRRDLQYILDPRVVFGENYCSETFPILRDDEIENYGHFLTQDLTLAAYDRLESNFDEVS